jgi:hypothetical protein
MDIKAKINQKRCCNSNVFYLFEDTINNWVDQNRWMK